MGLLLNVAATGGRPRAGRPRRPRAAGDRRRTRCRRIVIAAGGTAGHVVPALAVADALRERGAEVEFVGGERAEAELVPAAGYPFHALRVAGIDRQQPAAAPRAPRRLAGRATLRAARLLRRAGRRRACWAAAATWPGPVGLAARRCGCRWCSPRPTATSAWPTGCWRRWRSGSSSPSRSRAATAASTWSRGRPVPAGTGGGRPRGGARALRHRPPTSPACWSSAARSAPGG